MVCWKQLRQVFTIRRVFALLNIIVTVVFIYFLLTIFPSKPKPCDTRSQNHPITVSLGYHGGLGSNMFQMAFVYSLARKYNYSLDLPFSSQLYYAFGMNSSKGNQAAPNTRCFDSKGAQKMNHKYDPKLVEPLSRNTLFTGDFRSWRYFWSYKDDIRRMFTFSSLVTYEAKLRLYHILTTQFPGMTKVTLVSVHIKRGDHLNTSNVQHGFNVPGFHYYLQAIEYFRRRYKNVLFLVFSDDIYWPKVAFQLFDDVYVVQKSTPELDLATMTLTHHTIISIGSLGWWAGFLSNGETVFFKWPFKNGSKLEQNFDKEGKSFFPPNWIGIQ